MNYGPIVFLAAFLALASSWFGFVLAPNLQLGRQMPTNSIPESVTYPFSRPGQAAQGLDVYRANGCASCHSQQVRQSGTDCNVYLQEAGTNKAEVIRLLIAQHAISSESEASALFARLPAKLESNTPENADLHVKALQAAGAKADTLIVPTGPDITLRNWGARRSIADDFLYDNPPMPGSSRVGPDLADVGTRQTDANWHFRHLYSPATEVPGSLMPSYKFLFEKRPLKLGATQDPAAVLTITIGTTNVEVVPTQQARALVAYLLSLHTDTALFKAPFKLALSGPPQTNAPSATATNAPATNASATNSPSK